MPQLRSNDGELFELSEAAAEQSARLSRHLSCDDTPMDVELDSASLKRASALLEQTAALVQGLPKEHKDELLAYGLQRGAPDKLSQLRTGAEAALGELGIAHNDFEDLLRQLRRLDCVLAASILEDRLEQRLASDEKQDGRAKPPFTCCELIAEVKLCVGPEHQQKLDSLLEQRTAQAITEQAAARQLLELVGAATLQQAGLSVMNTKAGKLPHGWVEYTDERTGRPFFYNVHTRAATWYTPTQGPPKSERNDVLTIKIARETHSVAPPKARRSDDCRNDWLLPDIKYATQVR